LSGNTTYATGKSGAHMKQSKLELYINILIALRQNGPLTLTHIINKANNSCIIQKKQIDFLIKQGFIEERNVKKSYAVFAVTQRGTKVLEYFREFTRVLPLVEEA